MTRKIVLDIALFLYILLFVYAAISKLIDYQKFSVQLGQTPVLTNYAGLLAWSVPALELVIALLLVVPGTRLAGWYGAFGMMIMFTTYIIVASKFTDYVPCSCGGVIQHMTWSEHLIFNLCFLMLGVTAIFLYSRTENTKSAVPTR
jgi:uncharacterized membrane protein YphA (DoxX/SURF4 family)